MPVEGIKNPDYLVDVNPYRLPSIIWELVSPYMRKYDVQFSEKAPREQVGKPLVTWKIIRRIPGTGERRGHSTGPSFSYKTGRTSQNFNLEAHRADYRIWLEYQVYGNSSTEIDDIAWDLENAVRETSGTLESKIPGFKLKFSEQSTDQILKNTPAELSVRTLLFEVHLPVTYIRQIKALKEVQIEMLAGRAVYTDTAFTRDSPNDTYDIEVGDYKYVVQIWLITLTRNSEVVRLKPGTDYTIEFAEGAPRVFIRWNDENGLTPAVGEEFRVSYSVSTSFMVDADQYQRQA